MSCRACGAWRTAKPATEIRRCNEASKAEAWKKADAAIASEICYCIGLKLYRTFSIFQISNLAFDGRRWLLTEHRAVPHFEEELRIRTAGCHLAIGELWNRPRRIKPSRGAWAPLVSSVSVCVDCGNQPQTQPPPPPPQQPLPTTTCQQPPTTNHKHNNHNNHTKNNNQNKNNKNKNKTDIKNNGRNNFNNDRKMTTTMTSTTTVTSINNSNINNINYNNNNANDHNHKP